jgi:hypothetical protein
MQELKHPCIVLDSVVCQARYSECRLFCPRSIYPFWHEIWLERLSESGTNLEPKGYEVPKRMLSQTGKGASLIAQQESPEGFVIVDTSIQNRPSRERISE